MIVAATFAGIAASLAALGYLISSDPKRRRAFRLPPTTAPRRVRLGWAAVLLPGGAVAWLAGGGGFLVWFGAITVAGWALAAVRPGTVGDGTSALATAIARCRDALAALVRHLLDVGARVFERPGFDGIGALEARVTALEAELAALRAANEGARADTVVELPSAARR